MYIDVTCFPAYVGALDVTLSILLKHCLLAVLHCTIAIMTDLCQLLPVIYHIFSYTCTSFPLNIAT